MSLWQVVCVSNQFKPPGSSTNLRQPRPAAVSSIQPSGQSIGPFVVVELSAAVDAAVVVKVVGDDAAVVEVGSLAGLV